LFLALVGAYPKDSDSIFGHVFLVYAPENKNISFLNWNVVNFAADISKVKWYEMYYKGINGGFNAYYYKMSLSEKVNEYAGNETRDIRFFPVILSKGEFSKLTEKLKELEDEPIPYKFFTYNCADGTYQILYESLENIPKSTKKIMAPLDVVSWLFTNHRLEEPYMLPALMERIQKTTDNEQADLEFMEWQNKQTKVLHNQTREEKMAQLRHSLSQKKVNRPEMIVPDQKWTDPHGISRVEIGMIHAGNGISGNIGFRPFLHDQTDNQHFFSGVSTLEILSTNLIIQENNISMHQIDIFHTRSTQIYDNWFRSLSYDIYAGIIDNKYKVNIGMGRSFYLAKNPKIAMEFLLLDSLRNGTNHVGFETQILKHTIGKFRYGIRYEHLYKGITNEKWIRFSSWFAYDLNRNYGLFLEKTLDSNEKGTTKMSVRYYF